jgi:hypothetical protein
MFHWFPAAYLNWGLAFGTGQQEEHRNPGRTTRPAIADGPSSAAREVSSGYFSGRTNHSPIFGRICNLSNFRIHILVLENLQAENGDPRKAMLFGNVHEIGGTPKTICSKHAHGIKAKWPRSGVCRFDSRQDWCHLRFTVRNNKPVLENTDYVTYRGHIREGAEECYVSFPGQYVSGWDALTSETHNCSVACVFPCTPEDGLGQHYCEEAFGPCLCHTIYGERSYIEFGYLRVVPGTLTDDEVTKEREIAKHLKAVVIRADASHEARYQAEEEAKKAWDENGRVASWGCQWFQFWKENVEEAVKLKQRLKVVFFPGQVGQGKVAWEDLSSENVDLYDGKGCGGNQKCEIAYLEKMWKEKGDDWAYDSVEVTHFLKDEFKVGGEVDAFDGQQWWNGTLLGVPKTVPKDPRDAKWVVQSQAGEIFTTDRVRHADSMRQMLADVGQEEFLGFVKSALPAGLQVSKTLEFIFPNGTPSLAMRLDIASIAVLQFVRNTVLSTDLEMIVNKKLEMHSKSKWQVRLDKTYFCEVFEKELLFFHLCENIEDLLCNGAVHLSSVRNSHLLV